MIKLRQLLRSPLFERIAEVLTLAMLYALLGWLGLTLALQNTNISPLWPPMGLALAAVLLRGWRVWPGIVLGHMALNIFVFYGAGAFLADALGLAASMAVGGTLAPLLGVYLLRRCRVADVRYSTRTVLQFAALACVIAPLVSATLGAAAVIAWGTAKWADFPTLWFTWWVGDGLGALVVTPLLMTLTRTKWRQLPAKFWVSAAGALGLLAAFTAFAFGPAAASLLGAGSGLHYVIIIATLWVAYRFQWPGAVGAVTIIVAIASWRTAQGMGPLAASSPNTTLILLAVYLATLAIAAWAMAGSMTEHRRSVQSVHQLSQFNESVIDNASVWVDVLDTQANILVWNKAAEALSGYSRDEVLGHARIWDWLYPDTATRDRMLTSVHNTTLGNETAVDLETTIRCKDGSLKVISWYERNLEDEDGQPIGSVALGRDVSRQKAAEDALRHSEANFRALAENASDGIFITLPPLPGRLVYANRRAAEITGYSNDQLLQLSASDLVHPDHVVMVANRFTSRIQGQTVPSQYEILLVCQDCSFLPVEVTSSITAWHNQPAVITSLRDISERKRAEQALRASEERYRLVMDTANDMIILHDINGRITYANRAAREVGGYLPDELLRLNMRDIVPPEELAAMERRFQDRSQGMAGVFLYDSVFIAGDGRHIPVEANSSLIIREGKPAEVLIVARDIRERQHMQAERDHLRSQLLEAQKMEAVGQLAGGIAHDFNNLLTAVNGYAELIQFQTQHDAQVQDMAARIQTAGERAADLVRQLLAFARQQRIQPQIINVNSVVDESIALLADRFTDGIQLTTDLAPDLCPLYLDAAQVEQVVNGVLCHACDALSYGGQVGIKTANITLTDNDVDQHLAVSAGDYVLLAITHSGPPLDENIRRRIFEPFFFTSDAVADGIGLRLAAVYGIVTQNLGHIIVDSPQGNGTRYQVFLPRAPLV